MIAKIKSFRHLAAFLRLFSAKSTTSFGGGSVEYGIHFPPVLRKIARKSTAICRQTLHSKKTLIQANRCSRFYVKTVILHFGEQNGARTAHSPAIAPPAFCAIQQKIVCKSALNTSLRENTNVGEIIAEHLSRRDVEVWALRFTRQVCALRKLAHPTR